MECRTGANGALAGADRPSAISTYCWENLLGAASRCLAVPDFWRLAESNASRRAPLLGRAMMLLMWTVRQISPRIGTPGKANDGEPKRILGKVLGKPINSRATTWSS
jgi:hypothetical protein